VQPGEALALWGPNGAGKTTAIRCVLGLLRYQGKIHIAGKDARKHGKAARRALGYVPQQLCLHDDLRALDALHFYGRLKGASSDRPQAVLAEVGLAEHGRKRIGELSGGMKQRLALAIALLSNPRLLVLDELTANLDTQARLDFLVMLRTLKAHGKTVLFTSHRLDEVELLADRVLVMQSGQQQSLCDPHELADAIGLHSVLKLVVADGLTMRAVDHLRARGVHATPNGVGLYVKVSPREKATPIRMLAEASIAVRDFEVISDRSNLTRGGDIQ
jgi:ABC-type multidrug transport system ATPase subunit